MLSDFKTLNSTLEIRYCDQQEHILFAGSGAPSHEFALVDSEQSQN